jgi:shikimate dehydrogenase
VTAALIEHGAVVSVAGRNGEAGHALAGELGASFVGVDGLRDVLAEADLLVNATPVGQDGELAIPPGATLRRGTAVFDLVYRPRRTPLLRLAASRGCPTIEGIEMLIEQGAGSFEIWTGRPAPVDVMRRAAYAALEEIRA